MTATNAEPWMTEVANRLYPRKSAFDIEASRDADGAWVMSCQSCAWESLTFRSWNSAKWDATIHSGSVHDAPFPKVGVVEEFDADADRSGDKWLIHCRVCWWETRECARYADALYETRLHFLSRHDMVNPTINLPHPNSMSRWDGKQLGL